MRVAGVRVIVTVWGVPRRVTLLSIGVYRVVRMPTAETGMRTVTTSSGARYAPGTVTGRVTQRERNDPSTVVCQTALLRIPRTFPALLHSSVKLANVSPRQTARPVHRPGLTTIVPAQQTSRQPDTSKR